MEVILVKNVDKLGFVDDIVNVKPGFALNYLLPKGFAVAKNAAGLGMVAGRAKALEKKEAKLLEKVAEITARLQSETLKIGTKVGTTGKIFGSVSAHHIAEAIKTTFAVEVDRRKINIVEGEVKSLGNYTAEVGLGASHKVNVAFEVVAE